MLQELVTGYARFKGSKDWEGRSRMISWWAHLSFLHYSSKTAWIRLITLNGMKASEELTDEQSRQVYTIYFSYYYFTTLWLYIPSWFLMWNMHMQNFSAV
jgi:ESCRT-I complex subunit VPS28